VLIDRDFNRELDLTLQLITNKNSAFSKMLNSKTGKQLLKGFKQNVVNSENVSKSFDYSHLYLSRFKQKISLRELQEFRNCAKDIFEVLHLLHEDMKLNVFNTKLLQNGVLVDFLFKMCLKLGPTYFTYSEFYMKEYPELTTKYENKYRDYREEYIIQIKEARDQMANNKTNANFIIPAILSKTMSTVPSIYAWVESKLDPNQNNYEANYYCFFETSRKVCRLFDIFNEGEKETRSALHPLLAKSRYEDEQMEVESDLNTDLYPLFG
jgi:DNA integrity scanning protein DisA with diadenylate cyclase activity